MRQSSDRSRNTLFVVVDSVAHEQPAAPMRDEQAEQCAGAREQQAFGQQLPRDPQSRRAERDAQAELVPSRSGPGQQQVGEVRARDQQHQRDDHHDRRQRPAVALAKAGVAGWPRARAETPPSGSRSSCPGCQSPGSVASRICGCSVRSARLPLRRSVPRFSRIMMRSHQCERCSSARAPPISVTGPDRQWRRRTSGRRRRRRTAAARRRRS